MSERHYQMLLPSPVGPLTLVATDEGLRAVLWLGDRPSRVPLPVAEYDEKHPILASAGRQLTEYFAGKRTTFDIPLVFGGTAFQKRAWKALTEIPYGRTVSYGEQARSMGEPGKARAVGAANGRNPISIIVPCHRVIGQSGALTGFAAGLGTKRFLLELERGTAS